MWTAIAVLSCAAEFEAPPNMPPVQGPPAQGLPTQAPSTQFPNVQPILGSPGPSTVAQPASDPPRIDTVTELYRDGFAPGSTLDDFLVLSVPRRGPRGPVRVVKVLVDDLDTDDPKIFFINTARHETHWWFARALQGDQWSVARFSYRTYRRKNRPAVALNLVLHQDLTVVSATLGHTVREPITVELGEEDAIELSVIARLVPLLTSRLSFATPDEHRLLWLPPDEEAEQEVIASEVSLREAGVGVLRRAELLSDTRLQVLDPGVAYGTLRALSREQLAQTVVSTRDILLLSRVPNELPPVAGVITEELQTPLSHVSIASRARGTPNVAAIGASRDPAVAALIGKLVRFEVTTDGYTLAAASEEEARQFWTSGRGVAVSLPPADLTRGGLLALDDLGFADASAVGVKAANVAELHHLLGAAAPDGFAVPFSHCDQFLRTHTVSHNLCRASFGDCIREGRGRSVCEEALTLCLAGGLARLSLREHALVMLQQERVAADPVLREAALDSLRYQITHQPISVSLASALDEAARHLGGQRMRLRSSTNAEDLPSFSGAGLYRSVSSDPEIPGDTLSSEIRRVWASLWSYRAVEERNAWRIPHDQVHMAVLVHPATSGETANGVLVTADLSGQRPDAVTMNLQLGDALVTNPEGGALPEQLVVSRDISGLHIERATFSSLSPSDGVLDDEEIAALYALALRVRDHFAPLYHLPKEDLALDLEIKRTALGTLFIKQARPYPMQGADARR